MSDGPNVSPRKEVNSVIYNMTAFELNTYNDICNWVTNTYGTEADIDTHFYHFRDLYWREYFKSQKKCKN